MITYNVSDSASHINSKISDQSHLIGPLCKYWFCFDCLALKWRCRQFGEKLHRKGCVHRRDGYHIKNHSTSLEGDDVNAKVVFDNTKYGIPDRVSSFLGHRSEVNMSGAQKRSDNGQRRQYKGVRGERLAKNMKQLTMRSEHGPKITKKEQTRFARLQARKTWQKVFVKGADTKSMKTSRDEVMTN